MPVACVEKRVSAPLQADPDQVVLVNCNADLVPTVLYPGGDTANVVGVSQVAAEAL
jgi:hypothetical protein